MPGGRPSIYSKEVADEFLSVAIDDALKSSRRHYGEGLCRLVRGLEAVSSTDDDSMSAFVRKMEGKDTLRAARESFAASAYCNNLASLANVSRNTLADYESGTRNINSVTKAKIEKAVCVLRGDK